MFNAKNLNTVIAQSMPKNLIVRGLALTFVILLFLTPSFSRAEIDYTNLGINDGDEFRFVVDKFRITGDPELVDDGSITCLVPNEETGECDRKIKEDDEFTLKIVDATPFMAENEWRFNLEVVTEGTTFEVPSEAIGSDLTGSLLVPLDFEELKQATQEQFDLEAAEAEKSAELSFSGNIVETDNDIGINQSVDVDYGSTKEKVDLKFRFSKTTGFLLYLFLDVNITLPERSGTMVIEMRQISYEFPNVNPSIVSSTSTTDTTTPNSDSTTSTPTPSTKSPSSDPIIPGFGYKLAMFSFIVFILLKKRIIRNRSI